MKPSKQRRFRNKKYGKDLYPLGIIDIIERDYPDRYIDLSEDPETLFSKEEWLDILKKSRLSYEQWIKLKKRRTKKQEINNHNFPTNI